MKRTKAWALVYPDGEISHSQSGLEDQYDVFLTKRDATDAAKLINEYELDADLILRVQKCLITPL